jgi:hypothetical protein
MARAQAPFPAQVGNLVVVEGHRVSDSRRIGEILAVLGEPGRERYRVRWDDDHESVFYPSNDGRSNLQNTEARSEERRRSPCWLSPQVRDLLGMLGVDR